MDRLQEPAMPQPYIDLEGEGTFIRLHYSDGMFLDLTAREYHAGLFPDEDEVEALISKETTFIYDPIRDNWVDVEETKRWYRGIKCALVPDGECPF